MVEDVGGEVADERNVMMKKHYLTENADLVILAVGWPRVISSLDVHTTDRYVHI
jgi:hypothetical protein